MFCLKFMLFLFPHSILQCYKFQDADLKYDNSFFAILTQNYANKQLLIPNISTVIFSKHFPIWQIWGWAFQIWQLFFKILIQIDPCNALFSKYSDIFFSQSLTTRQIRVCWLSIWQYLLKFLKQNYQNKTFLVLNWGIFIFSQNFAIMQIWRCWFECDNIAFKFQQ